MNKLNKKRIALALAPLIVFNFLLLFDMFVFKDMVWSQERDNPYEWDPNERLYVAKESQEISYNGQHLFTYEGEDANCWTLDKDWQVKECLREHPYGGQGTIVMGGNLVVNEAQSIYVNGYDSTGMNWIMSSSSEPWGNAMGTSRGASLDTRYGNHLLANGTVRTGRVNFAAASSSLSYHKGEEFMVSDGEVCGISSVEFTNRDSNSGEVKGLKVLDKGVCGMCEGSCSDGRAGSDYRALSTGGLEVKESIKVNEAMRICGYTKECEDACCRIAEHLEDDTFDNFVGERCDCAGWCTQESPPGNCSAHDYGAKGDCTFCFPQPYNQYTELSHDVNYEYEKRPATKTSLWWREASPYKPTYSNIPNASVNYVIDCSNEPPKGSASYSYPGDPSDPNNTDTSDDSSYGGDSGFHHYNPRSWDGKGSSIVFCPNSPNYTSCTIGSTGMSEHGNKDYGRQVFTVRTTPGLSGTITCSGPGGASFSTTVSGSGGMQYGSCD